MKIERFIGGVLESNGYVLYQQDGGNSFIVDPGYSPGRFIRFVGAHRLHVQGILLTHHHYDHVGAVEQIRAEFDCPVYLHRRDWDRYGKQVDVSLEDGDRLSLDGEDLTVVHTPGHTGGSVCFYAEKSRAVFTGDTIFNVDLGRTDLEDGSPEEMEDSILNRVDRWSNDMIIYPGHGDSCTMKTVRKINREFLDIVEKRE